LIDGFDASLRMLDLIDRMLQLLVERAAIGYDNDAVEDLLIVGVVQADLAVGDRGYTSAALAEGKGSSRSVRPPAAGGTLH
jgi:hypothetical protein